MDKNEAREEVKKYMIDYLRSRGLPVNKKFICLNPEHIEKNPSMSLDTHTNKVHCFSCGASYDIIDLIQLHEGLDTAGAFKRAYEMYNIQIDEGASSEASRNTEKDARKKEAAPKDTTEKQGQEDLTNFFLLANKDIEKTTYHRGISLKTLNKYKVGYVENWRHPKVENAPISPRLIIPVTRYSYIARDTRENLTERQEAFKKQKVKSKEIVNWIFNSKAITKANKPIFVVEGELDALSIIDLGAEAIGLGSTSNIKMFLEELKEERPKQPFILSLDQDKPGQKAEKELAEGLTALNISFYRRNINGSYKDVNERLLADPEGLREEIKLAEHIAEDPEELKKEEEKAAEEEKKKLLEELQKESAAYYMQDFINGITESVNTSFIPTGFSKLDNILEGGLYEGLYTIGAISSLGKTTFILQIADQIAQQGQNVVIISLEMARAELIAKSISRLTFVDCLNTGEDTRNAKTNRGITTGKRYKNYSDIEKDLIKKAMTSYNNYANHIYIYEGVGDISTDQIREITKKHKEATGKAPVVIVDYLQIIAPADIRASDKTNTDINVKKLKQISRDYKNTIIVISSFNREAYYSEVDLTSFKESGAIEYSSDVIMALQPQGMKPGGTKSETNDNKQLIKKTKLSQIRKIELCILKQRNAISTASINFNYYSLFNYFQEANEPKYNKDTNTLTV